MTYKTLKDIDVQNKTVLVRGDLNVPAQDGAVTDTARIDRLKPTIDYLTQHGAKTLILSHFGRPKGTPNPDFSLKFLIPTLEKQWGVPVAFAQDCIGTPAQDLAKALKPGDVGLLENVRFHAEEEKNDPAFAKRLAQIADIYINDAFSASHRAHASTEGIAHHLPTAAGFLMEAELNALHDALESPQKPVAAIVGGAKISTKLDVLNNLVKKVDFLILGGGMANTFLHAMMVEVGQSLCEKDMAPQAKDIIESAKKSGCQIVLPVDRIVVKEFGADAPFDIVPVDQVPADQEAVDIGPQTRENLARLLEECKTVLWNGPLGVFEVPPFDQGTNEVAQHVAALTKSGHLISVAGGGDTASALDNAGVADDFTYLSTAGGAFLEWLEGKTLPGVAALNINRDAA